MLPKNVRLRNSKRIGEIFKQGRYSHGKLLLIKFLPNDKNSVRIAISVSAKLFPLAVQRNRIKRLIREAIKPHLANLSTTDILIIAKKSIENSPSLSDIEADLNHLLSGI